MSVIQTSKQSADTTLTDRPLMGVQVGRWLGRRTAIWPLLVALFLVAWLPRTIALDRFVTPDERKWLARGANYYQALMHQNWAHTFQREHPGVTIMWAGTLGLITNYPTYAWEAPGQFTWEREHLETWLLTHTNHRPIDLLAAGRWWIALWIALALAATLKLLQRFLGGPLALLAALLVALDPFHIALSRELHLDGLVSSLMLVALLAWLVWYEQGRARRWLALSGVIMGLAWLTKSPAILLVPFAGLWVAWDWWQTRQTRSGWALPTQEITALLGWGALATLIFVGLWPSMWGDPLGTLARMGAEVSEYTDRHVNANYFMGQVTQDPGLLFYPVAYIFRTTPVALLGLIGAAWLAWQRRWPLEAPPTRRLAAALVGFALLFTLVITLGAKKFDRYLLPIFLPLDIVAALGWAGLVALARAHWQPATQRWATVLGTITLLALHGGVGLAHAPYYLTYFNPLVGGSLIAPKVMWVGWGEGLDEAARWLNTQPNPEALRVASWYADGPFSYFFRGQYTVLTNFNPASWLATDFAVIYVNQWQRQSPSPEGLAWFFAREPVHVVWSGGLELARVYDMRDAPLPDFIPLDNERRADFGGQIRLMAYQIDQHTAAPGDRFLATFHLQSLAPMDRDYHVLVRLVGADGQELWRDEGWPWGAPTSGWPVRDIRPDGHEISIPANAPPGLYALTLSFYDPETFAHFPVTAFASDTPTGETARVVDLIRVGPPPTASTNFDPPPQLGTVAALAGASFPATASAGDEIALDLLWQSVAHTPEDYTVFVHLVGPDGQLVSQQDRQPLDGFAPTHLWDPGEQLQDPYRLPLPPDLPPGTYTIRVGLYTLAGGRLPITGDTPQAQPTDYIELGPIEVQAQHSDSP